MDHFAFREEVTGASNKRQINGGACWGADATANTRQMPTANSKDRVPFTPLVERGRVQ
jgi:hypothetical protein